jgi:hypothetical protein
MRMLVNRHPPKGFVEAMGLGMITRQSSLTCYPDTDNKSPSAPAALAAQKRSFALHLICA